MMKKYLLFISLLISVAMAQDFHATQNTLDLDGAVLQDITGSTDIESVSQKLFNKSIDQALQMVKTVDPSVKIQAGDIYLSDKKMRIETTIKGKKTTIIFRLDKNKVYSIDNDKKQYIELDLKKLRQMQNQAKNMMQNAMSQMGDMLKNLTPEQRAQMESMMGGAKKAPAVRVYATGKSKNIHGFATKEYRVEGAKRFQQLWISRSNPQMRRIFEQMQQAFPDDATEEKQIWSKIKVGWPVRQTMISGGGSFGGNMSLNITEITSIKKTHLAAKLFNPPAGYKKTTMQNMIEDNMNFRGVR